MRKTRYSKPKALAWAPAFALALGAAACGDDHAGSPSPNPGDPNHPSTNAQTFESDLPSSSTSSSSGPRGEAASDSAGTAAPSTLAGAPTNASKSGDADRAIVEADIIQVSGERLYALSRAAGLTIIDLTDPAHLTILGRYRELNGTPFEMYLRDGVAIAMYSGWGEYVKQADQYAWVQTSKVVALDVANPAAIGVVGSFEVAGDISDSRIVGDVMYVVGYQNGYCWGCVDDKPLTDIVSLNVKDVRAIKKIDELQYPDMTGGYSWGKRSVTVTQQRMYVAGPQYGQTMPTGSTIQVVDISDPGGDLVEGASIVADGMIQSRWQMDEYQGILRVISQTPPWEAQTLTRPTVQTFKIDSSASLTALGSTPLAIPANETLNTVHFDGVRGYAITSERHDPLITLDLTDPAHPRQAGLVEIPGWIYHLEPRGNRLVGLGYDQGNPAGAITVSTFDVTNLATPTLLDRVNFGGDWASLPEDQDRIQKAFKVLDDQGLILVPFSGWSNNVKDDGGYCNNAYRSGVQLVDIAGGDLTLRGAAPSRGEARRALLHGQKLLTVSDEAVDSYDIADHNQPAAIGRLSLARNVSHALPLANGAVARINEDWYAQGQNSTVDFVSLADVDKPERSLGELNLSELLAKGVRCNGYTYIDHAFVQGNALNLTYVRWSSDSAGPDKYTYTQVHGVLNVDASDPAHPVVLGKIENSSTYDASGYSWDPFYGYYNYGYGPEQQNAVRTDNAVVFLEQRYVQGPMTANSNSYWYETRLRVVDLTDPTQPVQSTLLLPRADGYSGLVVDGANVMLSHFETTQTGRARFYLDRVDLSKPATPALLAKVNVPGSLLHYDKAHQRMLTSELTRVVVENLTDSECFARFAFADFDYGNNGYASGSGSTPAATGSASSPVVGGSSDAGVAPAPEPPPYRATCTGYTQKLQLVHFVDGGAALDDSYQLAERERLSASSLGDARVAAVVSKGHAGWYGYFRGGIAVDACIGCGGSYSYGGVSDPVELLTLGGFETGHFTVGRLSVANQQNPWWGFWGAPPVYASGNRALVQGETDAVVVDLTDPAAPSLVRTVPLYAYAQDLQASGNLVLLALGMQGVQRIDL
ncbi:MAG: hypothetical protein JWN48_5958 [Myxococcaceae bacterium]|nr:hypothetical protein [Myxococcaceae bacterium]